MAAQRTRFEHLCKQNRWTSLGFFPETGSGTSVLNRPVLCNILQRVQDGGVDALWVKETDRLSRPENLGDLSLISQTLEAANTLLMVDSRTLDLKEDNSVLMLDFEGVLAKHFRRQLLRNMNRGKTRKAEMGRKAAGADIYGYRTNENGEYVPDPEQAKVVRLIFDLVIKGLTLRQLSAEFKRRGILTPRGKEEWRVGVLAGLLRNDIYLGVYRFQKAVRAKDTDGSRFGSHSKGRVVVGTPERHNHPPLLDRATFALAQQKLAANRKRTGKLAMATGLLHCPGCGKPMHVRFSTSSLKISPTGSMPKYVCDTRPHCPAKRLAVEQTNETLWSALVQLLIEPERIHSLLAPEPKSTADSAKKELAGMEREEKAAKEKVARLLDLYLEGNLPQASYVVKSSVLEAELARLDGRKAELRLQMSRSEKKDPTTSLKVPITSPLMNAPNARTNPSKEGSLRNPTQDSRVSQFPATLKRRPLPVSGR